MKSPIFDSDQENIPYNAVLIPKKLDFGTGIDYKN